MSKRLKASVTTPRTREEVETLVGDITALIITERRTKALLDKRLKEVKDDYQAQLVDITERLTPLLLRVEQWADANPHEFGRGRSLRMLHGTIGWRIGQPCLKTLSGWTWDRVLDALRRMANEFIRTKEEVDKQGIIAARERYSEQQLRAFGVKIVQEDGFFVEPDVTETETKITEAA